MMDKSTRYVVEDGLATGYWVVDSWSVSDKEAKRYTKWYQTKITAEINAELLNGKNSAMVG